MTETMEALVLVPVLEPTGLKLLLRCTNAADKTILATVYDGPVNIPRCRDRRHDAFGDLNFSARDQRYSGPEP